METQATEINRSTGRDGFREGNGEVFCSKQGAVSMGCRWERDEREKRQHHRYWRQRCTTVGVSPYRTSVLNTGTILKDSPQAVHGYHRTPFSYQTPRPAPCFSIGYYREMNYCM